MRMRGILAILFALGMASPVFADGMLQVVDATTNNPVWTVTVYNDSGSDLTSYSLVVWDNDDTEFDTTGYPYVTTSTTADSPWVAGVIYNSTCVAAQLCDIVVYGPTRVRIADATDNASEDTLVSTSTVAGLAGDYGPAANTCALGMDMEDPTTSTTNNELHWVFVNVNCQ